ncbi:MAG: hypothetical protein ACP5SH_26415 [Syntrophobacteraceae bacterium]
MIDQRYETRIVAYGDIIGWTDKCCKDGKEFDKCLKALTGMARHADGFAPAAKKALAGTPQLLPNQEIEKHKSVEFSLFSDNFAIFAPVEHADGVFRILSWRITNLLQNGFIVRGGVTIGQLYHSFKIIFGPALVEAVDIEKDARFPRFLCSHGLLEYLEDKSYKDQVIFQDCYEDWVVNTFWYDRGSHLYDLLINKIQQEILRMTKEKDIRKWQYMERMLPKMHELKGMF